MRSVAVFFLSAGILFSSNIQSQLIWTMDPAAGTGQFKKTGTGNCEDGSIAASTDPERGEVMRWHKPSGSNRCENHGIRVDGSDYYFEEGTKYYFGWWSKLDNTGNNNANFQWKSYENHIQNYPMLLKMINGRMHMQHRPPEERLRTVASMPIRANEWHHYVLAFHLSKDASRGTIEVWFDGEKQEVPGGGTVYMGRTYDSGDHNCPKWGIYGASGSDMSNYIDDLKVGTDYASVSMNDGDAVSVLEFRGKIETRLFQQNSGFGTLFDLSGRKLTEYKLREPKFVIIEVKR